MEHTLESTRLAPTERPSFQEAWQWVLGQLRLEMRRADFETWVQSLQPMSFKEGVYRLGTYNPYGRDWVESRLRSRITHLLEMALHQKLSVHFALIHESATVASPAEPRQPALPSAAPPVEAANGANGQGAPVQARKPANGRKKEPAAAETAADSPRKIQLQRAYGTERARVIQPERGMFLTLYFFNNWLPLLGHSAMSTVLAARSLCYWNPLTGDLRNVIETDMSELARRAAVSVRTVKDVLNHPLVRQYFLRYRVRRVMTPNGVRTAGIVLQVRMDDPLTPEDQQQHHLAEDERWYTADFEDEREE